MNNEKQSIRLPLCLDADITSECWNFYRMAIVNAHPEYEALLFDQFNHMYMDKNREIHYGLSLYKANIHQSYSAVLDTKELPLEDIKSKEDFINQTILFLESGMYPLVECDYSLLVDFLEEKDSPFYLHEILIYGVQNNNFIIPYLYNGHWIEAEVPVRLVTQAFWTRKCISCVEEREYLWRREYLSPYTVLSLKQHPTASFYRYDFYHDICHILERSCIENQLLLTKKDYGKEFPGVLAVYNGVLEILNDILDEKFNAFSPNYSFELNMKRLYEYACLFEKHICFFANKYNMEIPDKLFCDWEMLKLHNQQAYLLAIKFRITRNLKIVYSISDAICSAFRIHHEVLEQLKDCIEKQIILLKF